MEICRLHIVALPYYEAGTCLGEFLAEAQGRVMTLRPEPTNEMDMNAICAYDWQGRHVGYVAHREQAVAYQALRGSGRRSLRGRVCEVNAERKCVVFECQVETLGVAEELYPQTPYMDWTYSGPVLKPTQVMVTLDYMMDEISERLDEREGLFDVRSALATLDTSRIFVNPIVNPQKFKCVFLLLYETKQIHRGSSEDVSSCPHRISHRAHHDELLAVNS